MWTWEEVVDLGARLPLEGTERLKLRDQLGRSRSRRASHIRVRCDGRV